MSTNNFLQAIQQSYHIAVGATATLLETVQDPQKREAALSDLQVQWQQRSQEWSEKGEVTEREARRTVETWLNQREAPKSTNSNSSGTMTTGTDDAALQSEIRELTEQITSLRTELERSRQSP
jgi:polyhydroxyalkanoate synthesis regulator phasin